MESDSTESASTHSGDGLMLIENLENYIDQNRHSTNTQLFSVLALLKAYVPKSYLPMEMCQQILGPPDPIYGGPPFDERMRPFTDFISTATPDQVCVSSQADALMAVELLAKLGINRSTTAKNLLRFLREPQPHLLKSVNDLLRKRKKKKFKEYKEKFSRLISDILEKEHFYHAVSVLKTASNKFRNNAFYPQTVARLYYIEQWHFERAKHWANKAIQKAPQNSYVADTLAQVHKNHLRRKLNVNYMLGIARESLRAFKDVEVKAKAEVSSENVDPIYTANTSDSFNNRGHFGFIQVAKMIYPRLGAGHLREDLRREVEVKFEFFEQYLTYSSNLTTPEPPYFWPDIAQCYQYYTGREAADSTSFPALLDRLNHVLFALNKRQAEVQITISELRGIRDDLKTTYQENHDEVVVAIRYILSNIILSNKRRNSPRLVLVAKLRSVIQRFLRRPQILEPEPYLLALMLFWPEEQQHEADGEVDGQAAEDDESSDEDTDEDEETEQEAAPLSPSNLQQHVTFMKTAFDAAYDKYFRGRELLPLFFLGKGRGLSKWIHKSRLDAILEEQVDAEFGELNGIQKKNQITEMWRTGIVWQVQRIRDLLLPVQVERQQFPMMPEMPETQEVSVTVGEQKMMAVTKDPPQSSALFFLYFTIQGPVVINGGTPYYEQ